MKNLETNKQTKIFQTLIFHKTVPKTDFIKNSPPDTTETVFKKKNHFLFNLEKKKKRTNGYSIGVITVYTTNFSSLMMTDSTFDRKSAFILTASSTV